MRIELLLMTVKLPRQKETPEVKVGQQGRDYGLNAKDNFEFDRAVGYRRQGQAR